MVTLTMAKSATSAMQRRTCDIDSLAKIQASISTAITT
jgi:hypothetical protein